MTDTEIGYKVVEWWKDLSGIKQDQEGLPKKVDAGRTGERAELKRCKIPQQVLMCKGYYRLRTAFDEGDVNPYALATIAGVCSHVKKHMADVLFPVLLATPEKDKTTPPLSESRFQKMVTCSTDTEFYTSLRRALNIINNTGNISSIVKGVLLWHRHRLNPTVNVHDTLLFQWSKVYFDVILKKKQN